MINCIIIDDEAQSRNVLRKLLESHSDIINIVGEANSSSSAISIIDQYKPHLVFMDIHLGDGNAFDIIDRTTWKDHKIIFVTAYNEYALKAFRVCAIDYLLKPVTKKHLAEAIGKISGSNSFNARKIEELQHTIDKLVTRNTKIRISTSEGHALYDPYDIVRVESAKNYSRIFFNNGKYLLIAKTLKEMEAQLAPFRFERVHQSHLINLDHLKKYLHKDNGCLLMSDDSIVPVSQRKKSYILNLLDTY